MNQHRTHRYLLLASTIACIGLTTVPLAGCSLSISDESPAAKTSAIKQLQSLAIQKQDLSEKLWHLQNQKTIALNQGDFKKLAQLKQPLFDTQNHLTSVTNEMIIRNKVLRHNVHYAVLDNGQAINTWTLLKTDGDQSNHARAHILINKLRKLEVQQESINEKLWDDQNAINNAINHNNQKLVNKLEPQFFKDRITALPIVNQIDLLNGQIAKLTTDLQKSTADISSHRTMDDWIIYQTVVNNNQRLNETITPSNPNDEANTDHVTTDTTGHTSDDTTNHTNDSDTHSTDGDTGHNGDAGHSGGDAGHAGGGGHGE